VEFFDEKFNRRIEIDYIIQKEVNP